MSSLSRSFMPVSMALLLVVFGLLMGCGDDENIGERNSGAIQVSPLNVAFPQVNIGASDEQTVTIRNTADDPLTIYEVELTPREDGKIDDLSVVELPARPFVVAANETQSFKVRFAPSSNAANRGKLSFVSSDPRYTRDNPLVVNVDTLANRPQLMVDPPAVRFPRLPAGQRDSQVVTLRNIGSAPLTIFEEPAYAGGEDFRVEMDGASYPRVLEVYDEEAAAADPAKYVLDITVNYVPSGGNADSGEISVVSNDVRQPHPTQGERGLTQISVQANADAPCILVDGRTRNFGQVPIGAVGREVVTVTNCGSKNLELSGVEITENSDDASFDLMLGPWDANNDGEVDEPVTLRPGSSDTFQITFTPAQTTTDRGQVTLFSNDPAQPELVLDLVGRGSEGQCPTAEAYATIRGVSSTPRTSLSAVPLQYIVLDGSSSDDPDGQVVNWSWEVLSKPDGTIVQLGPTQEDRDDEDLSRREVRLLTAGRYEIGLTVDDDQGFQSCNQAVVTITAVPNEKVHIGLTWTNPEDPDESDDIGSDLDIHFVKMGPGRWFDLTYDVFFRNPNRSNDGGTGIWNPENPSLDIDVTNGAGPENITMDNPQACQWYAIGVHYYQEMFGTAFATVRIYINSNLVYEQLHQPMTRGGQFWDVARIHWDGTQATIFDYGSLSPAIPANSEPEVIQDMSESGLCTEQGLY